MPVDELDPIYYHIQSQFQIAYLAVVLGLLGPGKKPRCKRAHILERLDLLIKLLHRYPEILGAGHEQHILFDQMGGLAPICFEF